MLLYFFDKLFVYKYRQSFTVIVVKQTTIKNIDTLKEDVYIKETPDGVLELHLDTDDGNGSLAKTGDEIEIMI